MPTRNTRSSGRVGTVGAGSGKEPAKLLGALEAENAELREIAAELALKTAILRDQLEGRIPVVHFGADEIARRPYLGRSVKRQHLNGSPCHWHGQPKVHRWRRLVSGSDLPDATDQ